MSEFDLRPHHGLCIRFFEGKGYSTDFIKNMSRTVNALKQQDHKITLVCGKDIICGKCPNLSGDVCKSQEKVSRFDKKVLGICGITEGTVMSSKEFTDIVYSRIIAAGRICEVCGDCEWKCGRLGTAAK